MRRRSQPNRDRLLPAAPGPARHRAPGPPSARGVTVQAMSGPQERRQTRGRRASDGIIERDIQELRRAFDRLEREVGPVEGQVARVDGALQAVEATLRSLERYLEQERRDRRERDADLDREINGLREYVEGHIQSIRQLLSDKFGECMSAIGNLGADTRAGRRAIMVTIITTAGVILAAYLQGK